MAPLAGPLRDPRLMPVWAAAAAVALYVGPAVLPVAGVILCFWSPAPLVVLYRRQGPRAGRRALAMAMAGALVMFAAMGGNWAGIYFAYFATLALVLGEAPFLGLDGDWAVAAAALAASLLVGLGLLALMVFSGHGLGALWNGFWADETKLALGLYKQAGVQSQALQAVNHTMRTVGHVVTRMGPGILLTMSLLLAWGNLLLSRRIDVGQGRLVSMAGWRAPDALIWPLVAALALMVFGGGVLFWAAANLALVLAVIYFFQGLAVLAYWLDKKNAPRLLRAGIYLLVAVEIFMAVLVAAAGLFDTWFNFRRLGIEPKPE